MCPSECTLHTSCCSCAGFHMHVSTNARVSASTTREAPLTSRYHLITWTLAAPARLRRAFPLACLAPWCWRVSSRCHTDRGCRHGSAGLLVRQMLLFCLEKRHSYQASPIHNRRARCCADCRATQHAVLSLNSQDKNVALRRGRPWRCCSI